MRKRIATACYRELGAELRKRREAAGLSMSGLARKFGCAASHISRIESGHQRISEVDVLQYLGCCGVYLKDARDLLAMCRLAQQKMGHWYKPHEAWLPDSVCSLIYHESTASASICYEPQLIPGLLQTEGYIRALWMEQRPNKDPEPVVRARKERQRILHRWQPARYTFFLHENALRLVVGEPAVMHEQLLTLLLLDGLPHVVVRVVPASAGAQSIFGGSFRLLEYARHQPLVYLDGPLGGLFLEDHEYVGDYLDLIPAIADIALDGGQSREVLATLANDHDRERATPDAHSRMEEKQL